MFARQSMALCRVSRIERMGFGAPACLHVRILPTMLSGYEVTLPVQDRTTRANS